MCALGCVACSDASPGSTSSGGASEAADSSGSDGDTQSEDDDTAGEVNDAPESDASSDWFDDLVTDAGPSEADASPSSDAEQEPDEAPVDAPEEAPDQEPVTPPEEIPWLDDPVWQCANGVPISVVVDIVLPPNSAGCPWNEGDNLNPIQGAFAAYQFTSAQAELPGPAQAICSVNLESASFDPDYEQAFTYDDHFMLLFNDIVLLSSYGALVDGLPTDRNFVLFDWPSIAGAAMNFNNSSAYCLGYGGDDPVACSIPAPESNGPVAYSVGGALNTALSSKAVQQQRVEFALVTFGDNDPESDCRNSELRMQLVVDYVIAP